LSAEPRKLEFRPLSKVEMRSIEWLEKPLWQRSAFHLLAGKKGSGKGTYVAGLAARVSLGEIYDRPKNVLLAAAEDSDEIDLKPRIIAAGGDATRINSLVSSLRLPRDVQGLYEAALEVGDVGLIVLDPIASYVRGDTHAEDPVRDAIDPLNVLAHELNCAVLGVRHFKKDTSAGALDSILGAGPWRDVPRVVLAVAADDEAEDISHIKVVSANRSARGAGRMFRIELADVGLNEPVTRAVDIGDSMKDIDELLGPRDKQRKAPKRDAAASLILRELAIEPRSLDHLKAVCISEIGCSGETVWQAANALKASEQIDRRNGGPGTPWLWYLTSDSAPLTQREYEHTDFVTKTEPDFVTSYPADALWADAEVSDRPPVPDDQEIEDWFLEAEGADQEPAILWDESEAAA
jgi:putative DNA primase/helicase